MSPGRSFFVTSSASGRVSGWLLPKSTITGMFGRACPASTARSTGVHSGPRVVRRLDADDQALVLERHLRGGLRVHVGEVLLELSAAHPVADDVEEGEHAGARAIDDARLEVLEVPPAGAARVGDRGDADAEREAVGIDAVVAGVRAALAGAGVDVGVNVDQARA